MSTNFISKYKNIHSNLIEGYPESIDNESISICIPTFKRNELLFEAILSAINQNTEINYKVIVVDDDNDFSNNEIATFISNLNNKKLVYYKNSERLGLFGNMNRCIEIAQTKYIAFLHDDDLLNNNYIKIISKYINIKKDIGAICVSFSHLNSPFDSIKLKKRNSISQAFKSFLFRGKMFKMYDSDNYYLHRNIFGPPTCGVLYNKEICLKSGGWNEDLFPTADWFFMKDFNKNYKVYRITDSLAYYRWESNTSLKPNVMLAFYKHTLEIVSSYIPEFSFFRNEIHYQVQQDYIKYKLDFNNEPIISYSKKKMLMLKVYQYFLNLRYISINN